MADPDAMVRARALRTAGEIGCLDTVPPFGAGTIYQDPESRFWAAWSLVLLGDRGAGREAITDAGVIDGPHRARAFRLALQTMSVEAAHRWLRRLAEDPAQQRWLIHGSGVVGDPVYVPWLIRHMADLKSARLAAEAFSLITGADFDKLQLEGRRPENVESGPTEDPDDANVDMDPDEGLPWPDVAKVEKWWADNESGFQKGRRYFAGAPVTREHCIEVLKNGYQRQRILAAHYLCLLEPGTPLFNTSAPAWRQQRLLAKMT